MRTLLPADSLLYIETDDVASFLRPAIENESVKRHADGLPDLSVLKDVQIAVGVTGFATEEQTVDDETSVGVVRPIFVAVIDSNAWNYQVSAFVERQVGPFIEGIYGDGVQKDATDKNGGRLYSWTMSPTRRSFLFLSGSIFYFSNDETALNKALAVRRGEAESFAVGREDASKDLKTLARGFVTNDGVAQIASLAGMQLAPQISDDETVQGAVAGLIPQLIRNTIAEAKFDVTAVDGRYVDRFSFALKPEAAAGLADAMQPADAVNAEPLRLIPADAESVSQYNFRDTRAAYRAVVATLADGLDPLFKTLFPELANAMLEQYGIDNADLFLASVEPNIVTIRNASESDSVAVAVTKDEARLMTSLDKDAAKRLLDRSKESHGKVRVFGDDQFAARCIAAADSGSAMQTTLGDAASIPAVRTFSVDRRSMPILINFLSTGEVLGDVGPTTAVTETRFDRQAMTRTTASDTGVLLSLIVELLDQVDD